MSEGVKGLYESLNGRERDVLVMLAQDLQASSRPEKVARLKEFLAVLRKEIDEINARRKSLGDFLDNVSMVRTSAERRVKEKPADLELKLFRELMVDMEQQLKEEIALLRPERKLRKKFDVMRRIETLIGRAELTECLQIVFGKTTNPAVGATTVAGKHGEMVEKRGLSTPELETQVGKIVRGEATSGGPGFPQVPLDEPVMAEDEED